MKNTIGIAASSAAPAMTSPTARHPRCCATTASTGKNTSWPVALAAVSTPVTVPRRLTNQRAATVAATTSPIIPVPTPTPMPHVRISASGVVMRDVATVETTMIPRPKRIVLRIPIFCINAAANGPISPKSAMLIATATEIVAVVQPMSRSMGAMSTPGADRMPAEIKSTQNDSATMNQP